MYYINASSIVAALQSPGEERSSFPEQRLPEIEPNIYTLPDAKFLLYLEKVGLASRNIVHLKKKKKHPALLSVSAFVFFIPFTLSFLLVLLIFGIPLHFRSRTICYMKAMCASCHRENRNVAKWTPI